MLVDMSEQKAIEWSWRERERRGESWSERELK